MPIAAPAGRRQLPGGAADRRRGARARRSTASSCAGATWCRPADDAARDAGGQDLRQRRFPHRAGHRARRTPTGPASRRAARRRQARGKRRGIGLAYYLEATGGDPTERAEIRFAEDGVRGCLCRHPVDRPGARDRLCAADLQPARHRRREGAHPPGRHRHHPGRRRHRRRAQPVFRGPGDPGHRRQRDRQGPARPRPRSWKRRRPTSCSPTGASPSSAPIAAIDILDLAATPAPQGRRGERRRSALDAAEVAEIKAHTFPNGCHIAEVEIDPETGTVRAGALFRHRRRGQGGEPDDRDAARCMAAWRRASARRCWSAPCTIRSPDSCCPAASWTTRCRAPTTCRTSRCDLVEVPCTTNPLGVKGAGEAGAVGSPPAVINAILDALAADGVHAHRHAGDAGAGVAGAAPGLIRGRR